MKKKELQEAIKEIFIGKTNGYCISNDEIELNIVGVPYNRHYPPQKIRVKYKDKIKKLQYQSGYLNVGSGYEFGFPSMLDLGWNRKYHLSDMDKLTIEQMIYDLANAKIEIMNKKKEKKRKIMNTETTNEIYSKDITDILTELKLDYNETFKYSSIDDEASSTIYVFNILTIGLVKGEIRTKLNSVETCSWTSEEPGMSKFGGEFGLQEFKKYMTELVNA